jgi:hypothetical protein
LQLYESGVVLDLKSLWSRANDRAIRYGIGVSRDGFQWSGLHKISRKAEWPDWTPRGINSLWEHGAIRAADPLTTTEGPRP